MKNYWRPVTVLILVFGIFLMMGLLAFGFVIPDTFITSYFTFCTGYVITYTAGRSYEKSKNPEGDE